MECVAIVGVGLIGGSFGLALREAGFSGPILGVSSPRTIEAAIRRRCIDAGASLAEAASRADLIFLSQSVGRILDTLRHLDNVVRPDALVTDAGSTKGEIVSTASRVLRRCAFLGGHPMAGKASRGAGEAEAGLFRGRTWVLTPRSPKDLETAQASELVRWIGELGSHVFVMDPEEHDRAVALTSHLPQLASTALAVTVAENLASLEELTVAGPGLVDSTRLAQSSYDLWRDILLTNGDAVDRALSAYIAKLEYLRDNLRSRQIEEEFTTAAMLASQLRNR